MKNSTFEILLESFSPEYGTWSQGKIIIKRVKR